MQPAPYAKKTPNSATVAAFFRCDSLRHFYFSGFWNRQRGDFSGSWHVGKRSIDKFTFWSHDFGNMKSFYPRFVQSQWLPKWHCFLGSAGCNQDSDHNPEDEEQMSVFPIDRQKSGSKL